MHAARQTRVTADQSESEVAAAEVEPTRHSLFCPFGCQLIEGATLILAVATATPPVCNIAPMPQEPDADESTVSRGPQRPTGCSCFAGR